METSVPTLPRAAVFELRPLGKWTTQADLLDYVARTRRQLERFEHLPGAGAQTFDIAAAVRIRAMCDDLERDILADLDAR